MGTLTGTNSTSIMPILERALSWFDARPVICPEIVQNVSCFIKIITENLLNEIFK